MINSNNFTLCYTPQSPQNPLLIDSFFDGLNMPSIDTDSHDGLEDKFTPEEIATAESAMKSGKSPVWTFFLSKQTDC